MPDVDEVKEPELTTEEIIFAEDPTDKDESLILPDDEETKEVKKDDKEDKEEEPEIELKDVDEFSIVTPVNRKEILAAFPDLYKKFPFIETALSQHKQLTELIPTVDDAKDALEKATAYDTLYSEAMDGKTESILTAVKEEDIEAFKRLVDDYLPTLARVDEGSFHHVVGNLFKDAVSRMYAEARDTKNDALESAAHLLHQWIFGTSKWAPPTQLAKPKEKLDEVKQREDQFVQERFNVTLTDLNTRVSNVLKATIDNNIDPGKSMTPFIKKQAVREALENIEELIANDKGYRAINDRLWANAFKSNFSQESTNKIRSTYLARAKSLLRPVLAKARTDALEGLNIKPKEDDGKDRRGRLPVGRSASQIKSQGGKSTESAMKPGESTYDFLTR
jgi:hypothetical protein